MTWSTKTKTVQSSPEQEILTPDNQEILVGSSEDQILIYAEAFTNWGLKTKLSAGTWGLKTKVDL